MNILVLANFPPFVLGGAENQVARLVDAWLDLGHHVEVAGHSIPNSEVLRGRHSIRLHHIHVFRSIGRLVTALTYLLSLIALLLRRGRNFDVIYSRGLGDAVVSVCLAKTIRLCNLPLVACPINAKGQGDARFIQSIPAWRYIVKIINRHCNAINIIAADIKHDLDEIGVNVSHIREIPNGIPVLPLVRKYEDRTERKLIFTGRLSHQKGLDFLIESLAQLRNEGYGFQCNIVGDGPLYCELNKRITNLSLHNQVYLTGSVSGEKIRDMLLDADIFIMPSRYEGMSNSVLEAMESGMPVLVTRCGGIDHYINSAGGWTCTPSSQEALTICIREILETPHDILRIMGRNNRKLAENLFSIQKVAEENIAFFEQIILMTISSNSHWV